MATSTTISTNTILGEATSTTISTNTILEVATSTTISTNTILGEATSTTISTNTILEVATSTTVSINTILVACVAGAKRGGKGEREKRESGERGRERLLPNPHPFFASSLSPTPFDTGYAGRLHIGSRTLGSRGYFFLIDTDGSRQSCVNEARSLIHLRYFENGPLEPGCGSRYLHHNANQYTTCLLVLSFRPFSSSASMKSSVLLVYTVSLFLGTRLTTMFYSERFCLI